MPTPITPDTIEEFNTSLNKSDYKDKVVIVDFYADWCGPCKMIAPYLETLEKDYGIVVLKVNVDDSEEVAQKCEVSAMPTFMFYVNGKKATENLLGANKEKLLEAVKGLTSQQTAQ